MNSGRAEYVSQALGLNYLWFLTDVDVSCVRLKCDACISSPYFSGLTIEHLKCVYITQQSSYYRCQKPSLDHLSQLLSTLMFRLLYQVI